MKQQMSDDGEAEDREEEVAAAKEVCVADITHHRRVLEAQSFLTLYCLFMFRTRVGPLYT